LEQVKTDFLESNKKGKQYEIDRTNQRKSKTDFNLNDRKKHKEWRKQESTTTQETTPGQS